jgi:hypothetical protein
MDASFSATRRGLIQAALCTTALAAFPAWAQSALPSVTVYKSPACGCCGEWVKHVQANGFRVDVKDVEDVTPIKQRFGVPEALGSCHTATVGGYVVEGHVPAGDIKRLLREKPSAVGLAVPGMPIGSPGMEQGKPEPYSTLLFDERGRTTVFARH